jgi:hypothetical protein
MSQSWIFYDFSVNFLLFQLQPYFQKTNLCSDCFIIVKAFSCVSNNQENDFQVIRKFLLPINCPNSYEKKLY